jgi:hypothetical protein
MQHITRAAASRAVARKKFEPPAGGEKRDFRRLLHFLASSGRRRLIGQHKRY